MNPIPFPASALRRISDGAAVLGMLIAATVALLVFTAFFSVLRRFARGEGREARASMTTSTQRSGPSGGGI